MGCQGGSDTAYTEWDNVRVPVKFGPLSDLSFFCQDQIAVKVHQRFPDKRFCVITGKPSLQVDVVGVPFGIEVTETKEPDATVLTLVSSAGGASWEGTGHVMVRAERGDWMRQSSVTIEVG